MWDLWPLLFINYSSNKRTLLNTLVTILIPSNNTLEGLKTTLNSILIQTKIKGTRVLVMDYGSTDGSYQYAAQASIDFFKTLKIECLDFSKESANLDIATTFSFFVSPGVIFEDRDFIMNEVNTNFHTDKDCAYTINNNKTFFKSFFPHYFINKGEIGITSVLCRSAHASRIKNIKNADFFNFVINSDLSRKSHRISKARIEKSGIFLS